MENVIIRLIKIAEYLENNKNFDLADDITNCLNKYAEINYNGNPNAVAPISQYPAAPLNFDTPAYNIGKSPVYNPRGSDPLKMEPILYDAAQSSSKEVNRVKQEIQNKDNAEWDAFIQSLVSFDADYKKWIVSKNRAKGNGLVDAYKTSYPAPAIPVQPSSFMPSTINVDALKQIMAHNVWLVYDDQYNDYKEAATQQKNNQKAVGENPTPPATPTMQRPVSL